MTEQWRRSAPGRVRPRHGGDRRSWAVRARSERGWRLQVGGLTYVRTVREFVVARNPEHGSTLPFLLRLPLPDGAVVLKARDVWPRTAKIYCHEALGWPDDPEIVDRAPVRSCQRRGAAVDLVLDRSRENRSQFVFTKARGRAVIFWQSA